MIDVRARQLARNVLQNAGYSSHEVTWFNISSSPFYIAHRGDTLQAPENTMAGFQLARGWSAPFKTDVGYTLDGSLMIMHDLTVDRTTNGSGTLTQMLSADVRQLDAGIKFSAEYAHERVPFMAEALKTFAGDCLMIIDCKTSQAAPGMAKFIQENNLQKYVMIESANIEDFSTVRAIDPTIILGRTYFTTDDLSTAVTDMVSQGVSWAIVEFNNTQLTSSFVQACHAAGIKVQVWVVRNNYYLQNAITAGVDAYVVEDYSYMTGQYPISSSVPYSDSFERDYWGSGWENYNALEPSEPGFTIGNGLIGRTTFSSSVYVMWAMLKKFIAPANATINVTITPQQQNSDTTRWAGIHFCEQVDYPTLTFSPTTAGMGCYVFKFQQNGLMVLQKYVSGSDYTQITTKSTPAHVVGTGVPFQITVNSSGVTITRTDTEDSITSTDTTYQSGRITFVNSGMAAQFSNFSVVSS